jgi:hypothetical protein
VEGSRSLGRLALVLGAAFQGVANADLFDYQDLFLEIDLAFGFRRELPLACVDPARLQRATQGAGESTGGRGDYVVEGRGVVRVLAGRGAVVLAHLVVSAEEDGLVLDWEKGAADGTAVANDPDP